MTTQRVISRRRLREVIEEPKRAPQTVHQIGVTLGGGLQNILKVLASATPEEKEFWAKWYHHAKDEVAALAKANHMDFDRVAAAVAALSPGSKWRGNMLAASRLCDLVFQNPGATVEQLLDKAKGIAAYSDNIKKALRVLLTGDTSGIQTRKVWVFYRGLIDLDGVAKEIASGSINDKTRKMLNRKTTVDGHAINVWRGFKVPLDTIGSTINDKLFDRIEKDYQEASRITGLSTRAVQAITWYVWKYTEDPVPPPQLTITAPTPEGETTQTQELNPHQYRKTVSLLKKGAIPGKVTLKTASRGQTGEWQWSTVDPTRKQEELESYWFTCGLLED